MDWNPEGIDLCEHSAGRLKTKQIALNFNTKLQAPPPGDQAVRSRYDPTRDDSETLPTI